MPAVAVSWRETNPLRDVQNGKRIEDLQNALGAKGVRNVGRSRGGNGEKTKGWDIEGRRRRRFCITNFRSFHQDKVFKLSRKQVLKIFKRVLCNELDGIILTYARIVAACPVLDRLVLDFCSD